MPFIKFTPFTVPGTPFVEYHSSPGADETIKVRPGRALWARMGVKQFEERVGASLNSER